MNWKQRCFVYVVAMVLAGVTLGVIVAINGVSGLTAYVAVSDRFPVWTEVLGGFIFLAALADYCTYVFYLVDKLPEADFLSKIFMLFFIGAIGIIGIKVGGLATAGLFTFIFMIVLLPTLRLVWRLITTMFVNLGQSK